MARKKRQGSGAEDALFLIVILFIAILLAVLTAGFYLYPVVCIGLMLPSLFQGATPPQLPDPNKLIDADGDETFARLMNAATEAEGKRLQLHSLATAQGLEATSASGGSRYDRRKREAKAFNAKLELSEQERDTAISEIQTLRARAFDAIPDWRSPYLNWRRWKTWAAASRISLAAVLLFTIIAMVGQRHYPNQISWIIGVGETTSQFLLWHPTGSGIVPILIVGVAIGYVVLFVSMLFAGRSWDRRLNGQTVLALTALEERWNPRQDVDIYPLLSNFESDRGSSSAPSPIKESWWSVLGVTSDAAVDDIKTAYRKAILGYHSDRVAHLGDKLKEVADLESRRLNSAYETAKADRGFI